MSLSRILSSCILSITLSTGLLLLSAGTSQADLIEADLNTPGDGLITRDTNAGLDWLDLTATQGQSVIEVLADYNGFISAGFRYATPDEVEALFIAASIPFIGSTSVANAPGVEMLLDLMGVTFTKRMATGSKGMHDIGDPGFDSGFAGVGFLRLGQQTRPSAKAQTIKDIVRTEARFDDKGSYLVRPTPVFTVMIVNL